MTKRIFNTVLALVVALGSWHLYHFSDKEVIKRQLFQLISEINKEEMHEPTITMALKMKNIKEVIAKSCLVTIPERDYSKEMEPDLIIQYLIYHRDRFNLFTITFEDLIIALPAKEQAAVQSTIRLRSQHRAEEKPSEESHRIELTLVKGDERWIVNKITIPESLMH